MIVNTPPLIKWHCWKENDEISQEIGAYESLRDIVSLGSYEHRFIFYDGYHMMTSSNGNIFRVTGPLCGEFTGHRWIPLTKGQWCRALVVFFICALNKRLGKQSWGGWFETSSRSLWRHCNEYHHRGLRGHLVLRFMINNLRRPNIYVT